MGFKQSITVNFARHLVVLDISTGQGEVPLPSINAMQCVQPDKQPTPLYDRSRQLSQERKTATRLKGAGSTLKTERRKSRCSRYQLCLDLPKPVLFRSS